MRGMSYREPTSSVPLITFLGGSLLALDPERGTKLWERPMGELRPARVVVAGRTVFMATSGEYLRDRSCVFTFDLDSGADRGRVDARFEIRTAMVVGDRVYFGGVRGLLALRADGAVLFHAVPEVTSKSSWTGDTFDVVMKGATAHESWRLPAAANAWSPGEGLLVYGDHAAQPDFDS